MRCFQFHPVTSARHNTSRSPLTHLFEFVADEGERLVDGVGGARDRDDALRTRAVADVDLCAALKKGDYRYGRLAIPRWNRTRVNARSRPSPNLIYLISESLDDLALLADDAPDFLKEMEKRGTRC